MYAWKDGCVAVSMYGNCMDFTINQFGHFYLMIRNLMLVGFSFLESK